jgi:hypothetical protein
MSNAGCGVGGSSGAKYAPARDAFRGLCLLGGSSSAAMEFLLWMTVAKEDAR